MVLRLPATGALGSVTLMHNALFGFCRHGGVDGTCACRTGIGNFQQALSHTCI